MVLNRSILALAIGSWLPALLPAQVILPSPTREYLFSGNLNDTNGGPALISQGGSVTSGTYVFGVNQGLLLTDPSLNTNSYTIELSFSFDTIGGFRRVLDFKNRGSDTGLYAFSQSLNFFNLVTAAEADFTVDQFLHVVLTRDGATQLVSGYVNGQPRFSFADPGGLAIISGPNQELFFFVDDLAVANEASAGAVDFIRLYNHPFSSAQVLALFQNGPPSAVPEPSTLHLGLLGLGLLALRQDWRRFGERADRPG